MCVLGGKTPQLSSCKQNMHTTWWVGPGGTMVAGTVVTIRRQGVCGSQVRACVLAGGRDDDECARGHFCSKPLHICENLSPAMHVVSSVTCVQPQLSSWKQNMHTTWWPGGTVAADTCDVRSQISVFLEPS